MGSPQGRLGFWKGCTGRSHSATSRPAALLHGPALSYEGTTKGLRRRWGVAKGAVTRGRLTANALCRYTAFFFEESVCQLGLAWLHLRTFTGALASRLPFLLCCLAKS